MDKNIIYCKKNTKNGECKPWIALRLTRWIPCNKLWIQTVNEPLHSHYCYSLSISYPTHFPCPLSLSLSLSIYLFMAIVSDSLPSFISFGSYQHIFRLKLVKSLILIITLGFSNWVFFNLFFFSKYIISTTKLIYRISFFI